MYEVIYTYLTKANVTNEEPKEKQMLQSNDKKVDALMSVEDEMPVLTPEVRVDETKDDILVVDQILDLPNDYSPGERPVSPTSSQQIKRVRRFPKNRKTKIPAASSSTVTTTLTPLYVKLKRLSTKQIEDVKKELKRISLNQTTENAPKTKVNTRKSCFSTKSQSSTLIISKSLFNMNAHQKGFSSKLNAPVKSPSKNRKRSVRVPLNYQCSKCKKLFRTKQHLLDHVETHKDPADRLRVPCPKCDLDFSKRSNMVRHFKSCKGPSTK